MNNRNRKNLSLSKRISKRDALTYSSSKTKSRLTFKGFRLKFLFPKVSLAIVAGAFLLTLQPTLAFPPIKQNISLAQEGINQSVQIQSATFPSIQLPHPGYLSTRYSRFHPGVDIAMGLGTPIKPIAEGIIESVNYGFFGYGNHVIIKHPGGLTSMYAHMGKIYVSKDQQVTLETSLGTIGLTGFTTGAHTHLEITMEGRQIDPLTILPILPEQPSEEYLTAYTGN